MKQSWLQYI